MSPRDVARAAAIEATARRIRARRAHRARAAAAAVPLRQGEELMPVRDVAGRTYATTYRVR